ALDDARQRPVGLDAGRISMNEQHRLALALDDIADLDAARVEELVLGTAAGGHRGGEGGEASLGKVKEHNGSRVGTVRYVHKSTKMRMGDRLHTNPRASEAASLRFGLALHFAPADFNRALARRSAGQSRRRATRGQS